MTQTELVDFRNPLSFEQTSWYQLEYDLDEFLGFGLRHAWDFLSAGSLKHKLLYTNADVIVLRKQFLYCAERAFRSLFRCPPKRLTTAIFSDIYNGLLIPDQDDYLSRKEFEAQPEEERKGWLLRWHYLGYFQKDTWLSKEKAKTFWFEFAFIMDRSDCLPDAKSISKERYKVLKSSFPAPEETIAILKATKKIVMECKPNGIMPSEAKPVEDIPITTESYPKINIIPSESLLLRIKYKFSLVKTIDLVEQLVFNFHCNDHLDNTPDKSFVIVQVNLKLFTTKRFFCGFLYNGELRITKESRFNVPSRREIGGSVRFNCGCMAIKTEPDLGDKIYAVDFEVLGLMHYFQK